MSMLASTHRSAALRLPDGESIYLSLPRYRAKRSGDFRERDDQPSDGRRLYEGVLCLACQQVHIVNPATGRLMSDEIED